MSNCCASVPEDWRKADAFYPIKPDCRDDVPVTRFKPTPGKTLSARRWHSSFSEEGYLNIARVLRRIQRGGVHPTIKEVVWEFLLGCYDPKSTFGERNQLRQSRRSEYEALKSKCREMEKTVGSGRIIMTPVISEDGQPIEDPSSNGTDVGEEIPLSEAGSPVPEKKTDYVTLDKDVIQWKLTLHQIGLDVVRTDRALLYYENLENQARLWDILAVYSWIDRDIGYCQGMSDLCSPIIIVIENEADAFWCFERLMRRLRGNFKCTSSTIGVRSQLMLLSSVIKAVDPKLHEHIENLEGGEYLFAFRMLMVLFRRELSFVDALYLWEVSFLFGVVASELKNLIVQNTAHVPPGHITRLKVYMLVLPSQYHFSNPSRFHIDGANCQTDYLIAYSPYQLIWSMEYNPHLFSIYESDASANKIQDASGNEDLMQYGKFERANVKSGQKDQQPTLSIFIVASVLEAKKKRLLKEAKGLDDVVKILNDITGNLDAKKVCDKALKLHKKYLNRVRLI